jgi:hypothetical protein
VASTKIINVLRTDEFNDIWNIYRNSSADEVVFVLPKRSKAFSKEAHFVLLSNASKENDKKISVLCQNETINALASKYNFNILSSKETRTKVLKPEVIPAKMRLNSDEADESPDSVGVPDYDNEDYMNNSDDDDLNHDEEQIEKDTESEDDEALNHDELDDTLDDDENDLPDDFNIEDDEVDDDNEEDMNEDTLATPVNMTDSMTDIIEPSKSKAYNLKASKDTSKAFKVELNDDVRSSDGIHKKALDEIKNVWQTKSSIWSDAANKSKGSFLKVRPGKYSSTAGKDWFTKKNIKMFSGLLIFILVGFIIINAGSAKVIIKPKDQLVDFELKVSASDKFSGVDLEFNEIPGQLFSATDTLEKQFNSSGERDVAQKARGTITVYNEYSTTPQIFVAATRFEPEGQDLIFKTLKQITIPGTTVVDGEIVPGTVDVEIIADKPGDKYNIPSGRFVVPAFRERGDANRFNKYYGITHDATLGGIIGRAKVVTEDDYADAKEELEEELIGNISNLLEDQASGLKFIGLSNAKITNFESSAKIDDVVDSFTNTLSAEIETIGFGLDDLHTLISHYIESTNNLVSFPEELDIDFKNIKLNNSENVLTFTVKVSGTAYNKIDSDKIINNLVGKNEVEVRNYITSVEEVSSANIFLSPFWIKKIPSRLDKIKLELTYD